MLDSDTKRRIDTARDILVGKVPDPKSQVEQITIALIYKFMDDIDAESEALGGRRQFFAGDFARYGWPQLVRAGLGGHEVLNLYAEAIARMPENPGIPLLFRDIFNNAYLPYRDPETLRAFLKVIDTFAYDHSERLGDAFEYLLSVLGSQGDAGQFRTPRHIIDFMVAILDPKKDETVLDPACGTAGFLVSSYKHILKANTDAEGHSTLTPDEKAKLAANFKGYDISPDMVRLSLVNLYLHGFVEPHVVEYDTLTSEERWNEYADVILANPPFMSPKGGIRPHRRFSVQSKRSEVLFVDYMAEHLTPTGRAGIIVPEGIIFQSQTAHKQLRRMLVENYLVAVISLPAGVFQPYSGVKTSILILDKVLAKKADRIAFFKVANDGFDLGAQRREISENDLPQVTQAVQEYLHMDAQDRQDKAKSSCPSCSSMLQNLISQGTALIAEKKKIAANGEYNLSGERYRESGIHTTTKWPMLELRDICDINPETVNPTLAYPNETIFYVDISSVENETGRFLGYSEIASSQAPSRARRGLRDGDVLLSTVRPNLKAFALLEKVRSRAIASTGFAVLRARREQAEPAFIVAVLFSDYAVRQMVGMMGKGAYPSINQLDVMAIKIPLPPLEVQREIVVEIEGYQRVLDGARAVIDNYRPQIAVDPGWPMVAVREVCIINPKKSEAAVLDGSTVVSFVPMADMGEHTMYFEAKDYKQLNEVGSSYTYFKEDDVLIAKVTPCFENGKAGIAKNLSNRIGFGSSEFYVLRPTEKMLSEWLFLLVATPAFRAWAIPQMTGTGGLQRVPKSVLERYKIPLPDLTIQQQFVAEIKAEQALVNANRELVERFEKKIQAAIARVWGEDRGQGSTLKRDVGNEQSTMSERPSR